MFWPSYNKITLSSHVYPHNVGQNFWGINFWAINYSYYTNSTKDPVIVCSHLFSQNSFPQLISTVIPSWRAQSKIIVRGKCVWCIHCAGQICTAWVMRWELCLQRSQHFPGLFDSSNWANATSQDQLRACAGKWRGGIYK